MKSDQTPMTATTSNTIRDKKVLAVINKLHNNRRFPGEDLPHALMAGNAALFTDYGFSIQPAQGELIYLLCRAMRATRVVDFATSIGMSALYFAAAMKDNGGGQVIGAELVAEKAQVASNNLAAAGLAEYADIRVGDARETLRNLGGEIDFALIDGWPAKEGSTLARQVMEILAPQIKVGGYVLNDNGEADFIAYIRDPANGFISIGLPIKGNTELALKIF